MGENADATRRAIELLNKGKIPELIDTYDSRAVIELHGSVLGGAYKGKEGIAQFFQKLQKVAPGGMQLHIDNLVEAGDTVVVEWTTRGKVGGREFEGHTASISQLKGGKVVNQRLYIDTEQLARAAGKL